ncbi:MAG: efflux RND transporter permease subunit [Thermodesulfobacteriota bacterium]
MEKIARFILQKRRLLLATLCLLTLFFASMLPRTKMEHSVESFVLKNDPDLVFFEEFKRNFGSDEFFVLAFKDENIFTNEMLAKIKALTEKLETIEEVRDVISLTDATDIRGEQDNFYVRSLVEKLPLSPDELNALRRKALLNPLYVNRLISGDGRTTAVIVKTFDRPDDDLYRTRLLEKADTVINDVFPRNHPKIYKAGWTVTDNTLSRYMMGDLKTFVPIVLVLIASALYLIFRSLWIMSIATANIIICLIWTMGSFPLVNATINNITTITAPLIMTIGIAVAIHIIDQYREDLPRLPDKDSALISSIRLAILPCFLASFTTVDGFISLSANDIPPIRDFGYVSSLGISFSFLVSIMFIPIMLYLLRRRPINLRPHENTSQTKIIRFFYTLVNNHEKKIIILTLVIMGLSVWGVSRIKVETNLLEYFKKGSDVYQATDFVEKNLGGVTTIEISVKTKELDGILEPSALKKIDSVEEFLRGQEKIDSVISVADYLKDMNQSFHNEDPAHYRLPASKNLAAQYMLLYSAEDIRDYIDPDYKTARISAHFGEHNSRQIRAMIDKTDAFIKPLQGPDLEIRVTGKSLLTANLIEALVNGQIYSLSLAVFLIFGVIFIILRSFSLGFISIIPNTIPLLINLGVMGWLGIPLNTSTAMISTVAIGIAVDDTIHFLTRYKHERRTGKDNFQAIAITMQSKGSAVISTCMVIVMGFGILVLSNFIPTIQFGCLTAFTMLIALLVELTTLPILLKVVNPKVN